MLITVLPLFGLRLEPKIISIWLFAFLYIALPACLSAQMVTGANMPGFGTALGLTPNQDVAVRQLGIKTPSATMVNILQDAEQPHLIFHITNVSQEDIHVSAFFRMVHYGTAVAAGDTWVPHVFSLGEAGTTPVDLNLPKGGSQDVSIDPQVPAAYGGYALVLDLGSHGSVFAATLTRVVTPDQGRTQFPAFALDTDWPQNMNEGVYTLMEKLGVKGTRTEAGFYIPSDPSYLTERSRIRQEMTWAARHDVTVLLTLGAGDSYSLMQPLGRPRPWLTPDGSMMQTKDDHAWMPAYDNAFEVWVERLAKDYGWPAGNLNAVELWNEPWDGISISGWGADIPRYREIYSHMAKGVLKARSSAGVNTLIGGTSSSANARDKLFSDGKDHFLPVFDFASIHYQLLASDPVLEPKWMNRGGPNGAVRVWDTESWIANSEDRLAGVVASMRAQGLGRVAPIYRGNVYESTNYELNNVTYPVVQTYPAAAAIAAIQKFIGQRPFQEILFRSGLPWVFVFDGLPDKHTGKTNPEDGTIVILGDMSRLYPPERTLCRSVRIEPDATIKIANSAGVAHAYDLFANPLSAHGSVLSVPLNGQGYFLRSSGAHGSFAHLVNAVRNAHIDGVAPVELIAKDMTSPIGQNAKLRVDLTNVLNRPIEGQLTATLDGLLVSSAPALSLKAHETKEIGLDVSGTPSPGNTYRLVAEFNAGSNGTAKLTEAVHVNVIAKRTFKIDGDLSDWQGVLPQVLPDASISTGLAENAYLPFARSAGTFEVSPPTVWLAYDEQNFYFAARIPDTSPDEGMVRFENRRDDSYFYPDQVVARDGARLDWPAGVRHYSYRQNFDDPSGTGRHDNVQIAFNVMEKKPWYPFPRGTMPRFITYWDTDYEYALNNIAPRFGGGTEIWRLLAPGVPVKSYFPREPRAPKDQGVVTGGRLFSHRVGDVRIVEASIPWDEIPEVRKRIMAGLTVKFSCRVNDNAGPARELAAGRSVSKYNDHAFHDPWQIHWANEIEFGIEK